MSEWVDGTGILFSSTKPGDGQCMALSHAPMQHGPNKDILAARYILCPCFLTQTCCRLRAIADMIGGFKLVYWCLLPPFSIHMYEGLPYL